MNQHEPRDRQTGRSGDPGKERCDEQRPQQNPRLVFNDPDRFFRDLLMEQNEQG